MYCVSRGWTWLRSEEGGVSVLLSKLHVYLSLLAGVTVNWLHNLADLGINIIIKMQIPNYSGTWYSGINWDKV